MSAFPDDPEHFVRWLQQRMPEADGGTFAPRPLYGDYLAELLAQASADRIGGSAVGLTREPHPPESPRHRGTEAPAGRGTEAPAGRWSVHLPDGRKIAAMSVVLALGNLPPADPLNLGRDIPQYLRDPWAPGAALGLDRDAPVLFIGTGLTMIDLALALRAEGHRGPLYALSRHGRLPQPHAPRGDAYLPQNLRSPRELLRWIRRGGDWRAAVDALRPRTSEMWRQWSPRERASFIRHARNLWDVHRHRVAPEVAREVEQLLASQTLRILSGRVVDLQPRGDAVDVIWRRRGAAQTETLTVARVISCTGPATDYARIDLPLVVQLRRAGWLTPDPLGLGVETDDAGRLVGANGAPVDGLYTLGPLRRPALWESTAIPEIREQAAALAERLTRDSCTRG